MGEKMYKLRDRLEEELDKIFDRGNLTAETLTLIDKITHSMKSIDTICAMEEYGEEDYSQEGGYSGRNSYARGRGRNAKRDSMGRYARDNGGMGNGGSGNSYGRRYYRDGRSYDRGYSGADDMMDMFNEMMNNASDSKEREVIQKMMNQYGM